MYLLKLLYIYNIVNLTKHVFIGNIYHFKLLLHSYYTNYNFIFYGNKLIILYNYTRR